MFEIVKSDLQNWVLSVLPHTRNFSLWRLYVKENVDVNEGGLNLQIKKAQLRTQCDDYAH